MLKKFDENAKVVISGKVVNLFTEAVFKNPSNEKNYFVKGIKNLWQEVCEDYLPQINGQYPAIKFDVDDMKSQIIFPSFIKTPKELDTNSWEDCVKYWLNIAANWEIRAFEKVSNADEQCVIPSRATSGSAGYDFVTPVDIRIPARGTSEMISFGIKARMPKNEYLALFIRSSLAIKHGIGLANCTGIIDSDYYNNIDNEGAIMEKFINYSDSDIIIPAGTRVMQGIFMKYETVENDNVTTTRIGGVGSTGTK